jgi:hypothetical protein
MLYGFIVIRGGITTRGFQVLVTTTSFLVLGAAAQEDMTLLWGFGLD